MTFTMPTSRPPRTQWRVALLLLLLLVGACGRAPTPPVKVDFARLTLGEPLTLRVGDAFTLVGYAPEMVTVATDGIVEAADAPTPPAPNNATLYAAPQTTLVAASRGQTEITITQNLCEGVAECNGPALFLRLQVDVQ